MESRKMNVSANWEEMKESIRQAGGVFYQYRPCRRDVATMYDIENIRHGVVYAQTPLNMNDPFDSMIGFSAEHFFNECIEQLMDAIELDNPVHKALIKSLLKSKAIGKSAEVLVLLNKVRRHVQSRRKAMHKTNIAMTDFINQHYLLLYESLPKEAKKGMSCKEFLGYAHIAKNMGDAPITQEAIVAMLGFDAVLEQLYAQAVNMRDTKYIPAMKKFLSQLTVSCFSASGWDNQLMWSHYANSYAGICIEYDFSQIRDFSGFIYPIAYSDQRSTLTLSELGIGFVNRDGKIEIDNQEANILAVIKHMLVKNRCWEYENEWRIINIGEPDTPRFVDLPYVKSITFGLKMDPICRQLLWEVCQEKSIQCYQINVSTDAFQLNRTLLTADDFVYDGEQETKYVQVLVKHYQVAAERIGKLATLVPGEGSEVNDFSVMPSVLAEALDMIADSHFLKLSLNRVCANTNEEQLRKDISEDVLKNVEAINSFVQNTSQSIAKIETALLGLVLNKKLTRKDHAVVKKRIADIREAAGRFEEVAWNPNLLQSKDSYPG